MEWCEALYADTHVMKCIYRGARALAVFMATVIAVMWTVDVQSLTGNADANQWMRLEAEEEAISGYAEELPCTISHVLKMEKLLADRTSRGKSLAHRLLAQGTKAGTVFTGDNESAGGGDGVAARAIAAGEEDTLPSVRPGAPAVPGTNSSKEASADSSAGGSAGGTADIAGKDNTDIVPGDVADIPEEDLPAPPVSGDAAEEPSVPQTPPDDPAAGMTGGFLIDDSGMICGIRDASSVVKDSVLILPSDGCTGIASGAFSPALPDVREVSIPGNITYIAEGAFAGLPNIEWFDTSAAGNFVAEDGVLFSGNGTCLFAFPAGRTGTYKIPPQVESIAPGAFANAGITQIDATECMLSDSENIPSHIEVILRQPE